MRSSVSLRSRTMQNDNINSEMSSDSRHPLISGCYLALF